MLQIRNASRGTTTERQISFGTKFPGTSAYPTYVSLQPGQTIYMPKQTVRDWHPAVKQYLAEYMANGLVKVHDMNSSHLYLDKGNSCDYGLDYLLPHTQALALEHAIEITVSLHAVMNRHFTNLSVHGNVTNEIGSPVPTNLASLLVWLVDAQTQYDGVHRIDHGHPHVDLVNTLVPVVPIDLETAVAATRELHRAYHSHKTWMVGVVELDAATILTY